MERGGIQDPAEREVGHPLEVPAKGRQTSGPTPGAPQGGSSIAFVPGV